MQIPAGVDILMGQRCYYRNPLIFERPDEMIPERWEPEEKKKREDAGNFIADHPFMFIPFSFGPRICIGMRVATFEIDACISRLIQDYQISLAPNQPKFKRVTQFFYQLVPEPKFVITPRKK